MLPKIKSPSQLLVGRFDPEAPVICSEELHQEMPNSKLIIFEHSGYHPFLEEPEDFKTALSVFVRDTTLEQLRRGEHP